MSRKSKKQIDFESAAERLEAIIGKIDGGGVPLHDTLTLYKEGVELAAQCAETLQKAEQRVLELRKTADGVFETVCFE
jgi:exodeoxyribonuclease VII small subunit